MTLRVPFWVNDVKIGEVEISRTFSDLTAPGVHRYVWELSTWNSRGQRYKHSSIVDHREADGALALVRMVLDACQHDRLQAPPGTGEEK